MSSGPIAYLLRRKWILLGVATVFVAAFVAFQKVTLSSGTQATGLTAALLALRLFILEGDGVPSGGSTRWVALLWACYFVAPCVVASQLVSFAADVRASLSSPVKAAKGFRDHIVFAGFGKHAEVMLHCRQKERPTRFVIVERDPVRAREIQAKFGRRRPVIVGDMTDAKVLGDAGVGAASEFYAMAGDDVVNFTACLVAAGIGPKRQRQHPLIADASLESALGSLKLQSVLPFNPYDMAARKLLKGDPKLVSRIDNGIVIAGFGRFGQAFANALDESRRASPLVVVVLDKEARRRTELFARTHDCHNLSLVPVEGDVEDAGCLQRAFAEIRKLRPDGGLLPADGLDILEPEERADVPDIPSPALVLCTDNDASNFRTALLALNRWKVSAHVVCRMFKKPPDIPNSNYCGTFKAFELLRLLEEGFSGLGDSVDRGQEEPRDSCQSTAA